MVSQSWPSLRLTRALLLKVTSCIEELLGEGREGREGEEVEVLLGELGEEASSEERGEGGAQEDVDEGEHDAVRTLGLGEPCAEADGLARLEGEQDGSHQVVDADEAADVLLIVKRSMELRQPPEQEAHDHEVDDEDEGEEDHEAEPLHLQDVDEICSQGRVGGGRRFAHRNNGTRRSWLCAGS